MAPARCASFMHIIATYIYIYINVDELSASSTSLFLSLISHRSWSKKSDLEKALSVTYEAIKKK